MLYIVSKKPHKHHYSRLFYHYHESVFIKLNENTLSYKTALHKKKRAYYRSSAVKYNISERDKQ